MSMRRLIVSLGSFVLVACIAASHAPAATDLRAEPASAGTVLVWGNGMFFGRAAFAGWLRTHDERYGSWARLHPAGRQILRTAESLPVEFRRSQRVAAMETAHATAFTTVSADGSSAVPGGLLKVLSVVAAILFAIAVAPLRRLTPQFSFVHVLERRRPIAAAAAAAIAVGIAAAKVGT
jgi:hypothetical protein